MTDCDLRGLDPGECEAILLAEQHRPEVLLLIDEEKDDRKQNVATSARPAPWVC